MSYDIRPFKSLRLAGLPLRAVVALAENPITAGLMQSLMLGQVGLPAFRARFVDEDLLLGPPKLPYAGELSRGKPQDPQSLLAQAHQMLPPSPSPAVFESSTDFAAAYGEGRQSPSQVAEALLKALEQDNREEPPTRALIAWKRDDLMAQAEASTDRWKRGETLGPLDGIPIAVKDELEQRGFPTTLGTRFLGSRVAESDAEIVARLRAAGALLIGKANMHEVGIGVTGLNPHHGSARNPYDPARATGGSSSGSAAAVALGLCPIAVGADGGGSIRMPAALCGVVGLKATHGRISEHGVAPLCWSVGHLGPIAGTTRDAALAYALMAGPDASDPSSLKQPCPELEGLNQELRGTRIGVYRPWFEDAQPAVVEACDLALARLVERGAELVPIEIPELSLLRTIQLVTIVSEMLTGLAPHAAEHGRDYGLDVRLNLALARGLSAFDYVHAQRLRHRVCEHFAKALEKVELIATPSTGCTAPILPPDALRSGESNLTLLDQIMRFAPAGNVTGLPAISTPAGYDASDLPIGLQLIGRPWEETRLLAASAAVEAGLERRAPRRRISLVNP